MWFLHTGHDLLVANKMFYTCKECLGRELCIRMLGHSDSLAAKEGSDPWQMFLFQAVRHSPPPQENGQNESHKREKWPLLQKKKIIVLSLWQLSWKWMEFDVSGQESNDSKFTCYSFSKFWNILIDVTAKSIITFRNFI